MQSIGHDKNWLGLDKEDFQFMGDIGGFETEVVDEDELGTDSLCGGLATSIPNAEEILKSLSTVIISEGPDAFARFVYENKEDIYTAPAFDEDIIRALLVGYKIGITQKNGACANDLGAMYYMGDLVEQDYQRAAELYELAIQWG